MPATRIGEYWTGADPSWTIVYADLIVWDDEQKIYAPLPSLKEVGAAVGKEYDYLELSTTFNGCYSLIASPKLPDEAVMLNNLPNGIFSTCQSLLVAPRLPKPVVEEYAPTYAFYKCLDLVQAPVIPPTAERIDYMFFNTEITAPVSIPRSVRFMDNLYAKCSKLSGEFAVRVATLRSASDALKDTRKSLTLYGDRSVCETIAATANNGNASWHPWYDPVPAVTNRGPNSYTTAEDMTRMVRNGALAVDTYAPGRMVYHQGDIVREDEWNALVEAAQTIDPTVTYSTVYSNLNKIEAAFDSAL